MASGFCEPPGGGSAGDDAGTGGGVDSGSGGQTGCLQHWLDGAPSLVLSQPKELTALASASEDRDPWISADGLRLYFGRNPGSQGASDIYLAIRASTAVDFSGGAAVVNLDTVDSETRPALSGDETLLVLSGNHSTAGGRFQLVVARRSDPAMPFPSPSSVDQALVANVNNASQNYFDPFVSADSLRLYFATSVGGAPLLIQQASRPAANQNFGSLPVTLVNSGIGDDSPALSIDERIVVFSSNRSGGPGATDLWYATRPSVTDGFTTPRLIPTVNGTAQDEDPMLSADGCDLYFASNRVGGKYHLFQARVMN